MPEEKIIKAKLPSKNMLLIALVIIVLVLALVISIMSNIMGSKISELEQQVKAAEEAVPAIVVTNDPVEPVVEKFEITMDFLKSSVSTLSNLETSEVYIYGVCKFETEGNIFTKNSYSMLYKANVKAVIDLSDVDFEITDDKVIVTLPNAQMTTPVVDPYSVQFYDIKKSWFNPIELDDPINSVKLVMEDIEQNYDFTEVLESADKQAEAIITGMLTQVVKQAEGERDLVVKHEEE